MKLTSTQKLILFSLGQYYRQLNQPLTEKPLKLSTMKITFIELLQKSDFKRHPRTIYKNIEALEKEKLISYNKRLISFTDKGLEILSKIDKEHKRFVNVENYIRMNKPMRKLQTVIKH